MLTRRTVMLAKVEASYGVDPTPTVAANAILVNDVNLKIAGEVLERDFYKSSLSKMAFARGIKHAEVSFGTELKGTGTRGTLPSTGWEGTLFRGCGFAETVVASTRVAYAPVSTGFEGMTLWVYRDGIYHKINGCMGDKIDLTFEVGKYPVAKWSFKGLYATPTDSTPSTQSFSSVVPPTCLSGALTVTASAGTLSTAGIVEKVQITVDNTLAMRKSINEATGILGWTITDRKISGSFDPEVITEASYAFWARWAAATQSVLNLGPLGATSGNMITIGAPAIQYRDLDYQDRSGQLVYQIPFDLAMSTGDDEFTVTFT